MKRKNHLRRFLILGIVIYFTVVEIYEWQIEDQFNWALVGVILLVGLVAFSWTKWARLRRLIGEDTSTQRTRVQSLVYCYTWPIVFVPLSIYLLTNESNQSVSPVVKFSLIAVAPTLGGLVLSAASNIKGNPKKRSELIRVAQKLISATILLILFVPFLYMVDLLKGIDVNSIDIYDVEAWFRGIYFWLGALCFFGGMLLFLWGVTDFIFALEDLNATYVDEIPLNGGTTGSPAPKLSSPLPQDDLAVLGPQEKRVVNLETKLKSDDIYT
ncbi:MAG: hypothetical protein WC593_15885 [Methanoregula sp.]